MNIVTNGIPLINGVEPDWGSIVMTIGGIPITGITAISYGDEQEVKNNYGAGRHPVSRSKGRITPSAKITLYVSEVARIQAQALNGRLQDLAPFDIVVSQLPEDGQITQDTIKNCSFKKNDRNWKEGDTSSVVELELIPSHIKWDKK